MSQYRRSTHRQTLQGGLGVEGGDKAPEGNDFLTLTTDYVFYDEILDDEEYDTKLIDEIFKTRSSRKRS